MKFAFITLDFRRYPLDFCFECASYYGFDGVEIWCGRPHAHPDDMDQEAIGKILSLKDKYQLEIPMLVPAELNVSRSLASLNELERKQAVESMKRHVDLANSLACPRVLTVADHPGYNQDRDLVWAAFVQSLEELLDHASGTGVKISVEPLTAMESPVVCTVDDCARLQRDIDHPQLHFLMDMVPPILAFEPYSDYFSKLGDRMDYIHICNTDGVSDAHLRLEDGIVPLEDMLTVFQRWGYDGYLSTELYSENYRDPELFLANSARVLKGICQRLGIDSRVGQLNRK